MHFGTLLGYRMHTDLRHRRMKYWSWERYHALLMCQMGED